MSLPAGSARPWYDPRFEIPLGLMRTGTRAGSHQVGRMEPRHLLGLLGRETRRLQPPEAMLVHRIHQPSDARCPLGQPVGLEAAGRKDGKGLLDAGAYL